MKSPVTPPREYISRPKPPTLFPVGIAGASLGIALLFCLIADQFHPPVHVSLTSAAPAPGEPLLVSESKAIDDATDPTPLEADLGNFSITQLPSRPLPQAHGQTEEVTLLLPISHASCEPLQQVLGGGCEGEPAQPGKQLEGIEVSPLRKRDAISMQFQPQQEGVWELTQSTPATEQAIPTAWSIQTDSVKSDITFGCSVPMPLLVAVPPHRQRVECVPGKAVFRLPVLPRRPTTPVIFLNEVSRMEAELSGEATQTGVLHGALTIGNEQDALDGGESRLIAIASDHQRGVEVKLEDSVDPEVANLTVDSEGASTVTVDDVNRIPSWLDRHEDLKYLLLGLTGGALAATLIDYLAKRRGALSR